MEPFTESSPEVERMLPEFTSLAAWFVSNAEMLREMPDAVVDEHLRQSATKLLNTAMGFSNPPEQEEEKPNDIT